MKKILVINSGSSSLKFSLFEMPEEKVLVSGIVERIGLENSILKLNHKNKKIELQVETNSHKDALKIVSNFLLNTDNQLINNVDEIDSIGHRVVHGGSLFSETTLITEEVKQNIKELFSLAPLHNPANLTGIEVAEEIFPNAQQIAVFDTAFHQTIPEKAHRYAIPNEFYTQDKVRLYGFHGTSHKYVSKKAIEYLQNQNAKIIVLHLGNGCSATAIQNGKSIDHSLGFGPLSGLVMGTRSGDLDPAVVLYLQEKGYSIKELSDILNKKSGLLGLTGFSDMREVESGYHQGDKNCKIALEIVVYRIKKYIGAYVATMNGLDALVFTAGIGENSKFFRNLICEDMNYFGFELEDAKNNSTNQSVNEIQTINSKTKLLVIPTNEELEIANQCLNLY
jgi:acetate kinase